MPRIPARFDSGVMKRIQLHARRPCHHHPMPNPSLNRTRNGVPRLGLISFWPRRGTPLRAG
jgi:hypothetical protein